jgi:hypothetical protein
MTISYFTITSRSTWFLIISLIKNRAYFFDYENQFQSNLNWLWHRKMNNKTNITFINSHTKCNRCTNNLNEQEFYQIIFSSYRTWHSSLIHLICTVCRNESFKPAWYESAWILCANKYWARKNESFSIHWSYRFSFVLPVRSHSAREKQ